MATEDVAPNSGQWWSQATNEMAPRTFAEFTEGRRVYEIGEAQMAMVKGAIPKHQYDIVFTHITDPDRIPSVVVRARRAICNLGDFLTLIDDPYLRQRFGEPQVDIVEGYYLWLVDLECAGC